MCLSLLVQRTEGHLKATSCEKMVQITGFAARPEITAGRITQVSSVMSFAPSTTAALGTSRGGAGSLVKVATIGEILVEVMAVEPGQGFLEPLSLRGPFPSGAPGIFIDQVAKLGQPCAVIACVGDDDFGRASVARLERDGVDTTAVEVLAGEVTGSAFVRYRDDGKRDFVFNVVHSAAGRLKRTPWATGVLAGCGHLHISGSSLFSDEVATFVLSAAQELKAKGGTVSFDPNVRPELLKDDKVLANLQGALRYADVFLPSGPEVALLTRAKQEQAAIEEVLAGGARCVVVKRGLAGASYYGKEERLSVPAYAVEEVDPTGAGDCFDAAFVTCWLRGRGARECLELANAAGAKAVSAFGPMEGTSSMAELEELRSKARSRSATPPGAGGPGRKPRVLDAWVMGHLPGLTPEGVTSVCSSHELVLEAALRQAAEEGTAVLIEATCNQVNHRGGYSGLTPAAFRDHVYAVAERLGFPKRRVLLGGDHLGPSPWRARPAEQAMADAEEMVAAFVMAGFEKLHIDTSMGCQGEPSHLEDEVVAERAARLAAVAEQAAKVAGTRPYYVVGTEVPVPGGLSGEAEAVHVTSPEAVLATLEAHRRAFSRAGAGDAFERVMAVVAHPGVEFDNQKVFIYQPERAKDLSRALDLMNGLCFEAHSTDYQPASSLARLVDDGFAVLKVGPALTFALREALYGLDAAAWWAVPAWRDRTLAAVVDEEMLARPEHWSAYVSGDPARQRLLRHFGYSDRSRYYWASPRLRQAVDDLFGQFEGEMVPEMLVSQYLPRLFERVARGELPATPRALVIEAVRDVLRPYWAACAARSRVA